MDHSAQAFIADGTAFRRVISAVTSLTSIRPTAFDPAKLQIAAMRDAKANGEIRDELDPHALGRQIWLSYVGALVAWSGGALSHDGFLLAARHGLVAVLVVSSRRSDRPRSARRRRSPALAGIPRR